MYCDTKKRTVVKDILNKEIKRQMAIYENQSNDDFRNTLSTYLHKFYPAHVWTVSSYNGVNGSNTHAYRGNYGHVLRYKNKNVVVYFSRKGTVLPSSAKRTEITNAVLAAVTNKVSHTANLFFISVFHFFF